MLVAAFAAATHTARGWRALLDHRKRRAVVGMSCRVGGGVVVVVVYLVCLVWRLASVVFIENNFVGSKAQRLFTYHLVIDSLRHIAVASFS